MARKPAHVKPDGRQLAWAAMRKLKQFTLEDLELATKERNSTLSWYLRSLCKGGYVEMVGHDTRRTAKSGGRYATRNAYQPAIYRLIKDVGYHAPRIKPDGSPITRGRAVENMWRVMKVLSEFDLHELADASSGNGVAVSASAAKNYMLYLEKAGYLRLLQKGRPGAAARYALIKSRWSGPKAPMVQRVQQVFDPNLGQVVWPKDGER